MWTLINLLLTVGKGPILKIGNLRYIFLLTWASKVFLLMTLFNNISVISWQAILLVKETGVHREN